MKIPRLFPRWLPVLAFLATFCALSLSRNNPQLIPVRLQNGVTVNLSLQLSPPATEWMQSGPSAYTASGYSLSVEEHLEGTKSELRVEVVREDEQSFTVNNFQAVWEMTAPELFGIWTYNHVPAGHLNYRAEASESFWDLTAPNSGIPYVLAARRDGTNALAAGLLSQTHVLNVQGQPLESGGYQVSMDTRIPFQTRQFQEVIYSDTTPDNWYKVTQHYADWVDAQRNYAAFPISPACYYPMYDIWYWAFDNTTAGLYWTTLVQAKQLSFKSYLFDAGWESFPGELTKWLEGTLGDYEHSEDKLLGFPGFLQYVKDRLRMNVVLWMAPYAVGRQSQNYRATRRLHTLFNRANLEYKGGIEASPMTLRLGPRFDENVNLCPRNSDTHQYLKGLMERVSGSYRPNGYWLDFQETIPFLCESFHRHTVNFGQGLNQAQETIARTALDHIPQATVEMRFPVANLNNKPYANIWQSIDSPGDFDTMRLCTIRMRPFSRGVVMGTDEMYWPPDTDEVTAGKFAATTVLSGVPAFGANFLDAPRSHSSIVRAWLRFYNHHQEELTSGEFLPFGDFGLPNHKIESAESAFVYLRNLENTSEVPLANYPKAIFLVNCTEQDAVDVLLQGVDTGDYTLQVLNHFLRPIVIYQISLDNPARIQTSIPQGGMLQLSRSQ